MNHRDFPSIRDAIALASMLQRGEDLWPVRQAAWKEVQRLRRWRGKLAEFNTPSALKYKLTKEQFDLRMRVINVREKLGARLDEAYRRWAETDAEIETIMRDSRYQAWRNATTAGQDEIIELARGA